MPGPNQLFNITEGFIPIVALKVALIFPQLLLLAEKFQASVKVNLWAVVVAQLVFGSTWGLGSPEFESPSEGFLYFYFIFFNS